MAKTKSIEEKVEEFYKKILDDLGITYYGKTQAHLISPSIDDAFKSAPSKSGGTGSNYPDMMLMLNSKKLNRSIPVIIEAKGSKNKLEKIDNDGNIVQIVPYDNDSKKGVKNPHRKGDPNPDAIVNFAVNGAYHYAKIILNDERTTCDEVIFIGINGTGLDKDNKVKNPEQKAYYLSKSNKLQYKHIADLDKSWDLLKETNLEKLFTILDRFTLSEDEIEALTHRTEDELEKAVKKIHQEIYDNKSLKNALTTNEKLYLFTGLIMAGLQTSGVSRLTPKGLEGNDDKLENDGQTILRRIKTFLEKRKADSHKITMIEDLLRPIFIKEILWKPHNGASLIKHIFTDVYDSVIPLLESDLQLDFTGKIFNSLNDWVSIDNDADNDVVLTPRYVTELMVKLTRTNMDSYVWDTAMGSGGFLVSAMNAMIKDATYKIQDKETLANKISHIKEQQLLGIELLGNIYILAILNMILMGDGSSHMRNGNSHELYDKEHFPANVFLLNPPYSAAGKGFNFVEEAFSKMERGYGAILIQESAGSGQGTPYTKRILERNTLIASIHMPSDLFGSKASVQAAIYVFKVNEPHNEKQMVTFIDFSEDGYARQNRKKSSQAVNLRDADNAKARYQEVADIVCGNLPDTTYYTEENGKVIRDRITLNGDDWTYSQHKKVDTIPQLDDFKKTVADYLSWEVSQLLQQKGEDPSKKA